MVKGHGLREKLVMGAWAEEETIMLLLAGCPTPGPVTYQAMQRRVQGSLQRGITCLGLLGFARSLHEARKRSMTMC